MGKYIDADKLIKSVNNYREGAKAALNSIDDDADYYKGKIDTCENIQEIIASLQQEQPEVDLEKEIEEWIIKGREDFELDGWVAMGVDCIARHFYELGLNARKEY